MRGKFNLNYDLQPGWRFFGSLVGPWSATSAPANNHHRKSNYQEMYNQFTIDQYVNNNSEWRVGQIMFDINFSLSSSKGKGC